MKLALTGLLLYPLEQISLGEVIRPLEDTGQRISGSKYVSFDSIRNEKVNKCFEVCLH